MWTGRANWTVVAGLEPVELGMTVSSLYFLHWLRWDHWWEIWTSPILHPIKFFTHMMLGNIHGFIYHKNGLFRRNRFTYVSALSYLVISTLYFYSYRRYLNFDTNWSNYRFWCNSWDCIFLNCNTIYYISLMLDDFSTWCTKLEAMGNFRILGYRNTSVRFLI